MRLLLSCALILLLATAGCYKPKSAGLPLGSTNNPIIMAFVPSIEAEKVVDSGGHLCALLSDETGLTFRPMAANSYVGIVEAMAAGKVHVAWLPPMAYVFAHERNGDRAALKVVRHGLATYRGQIVVPADSPIRELADLKGKRIAFADQTSASGHLYPRTLLQEAGLDVDRDCEVIFAASHDAALTTMLRGSADAACCFDDARRGLQQVAFPDIMETTRVLALTPPIPADCVAVAAKLDEEIAAKTVEGLLALADDERGKQVLFQLYEVEGLVPATDEDYDPVRVMARILDLDVETEVQRGE